MFRHKKFRKRLRLEYTDGKSSGKGYTTEVSEDGLAISCRKPLTRGTKLELVFDLPDGTEGRAKAKVMASKKQVSGVGESGMEVELLLYNKKLSDTLHSIVGEFQSNDLSLLVKPGDFPGDPDDTEIKKPEPPVAPPKPEARIPEKEEPVAPEKEEPVPPEPEEKEPVAPEEKEPVAPPVETIECIEFECGFCGTMNTVPEDKLFEGAVCSMCQEKLIATS